MSSPGWTAPDVERVDPPREGDERATLEAYLDYHRATLLMKCAGLGAEDLRRRACEPSTLSLLGLVRHMSEVERWWFQRNLAGLDVGPVYCDDETGDADFDDVDTADPAAALADFAAECAASRAISAGRSLDETFVHPRRQIPMSVRWMLVHMVEEYARHNGHADLLRERIDGRTGE